MKVKLFIITLIGSMFFLSCDNEDNINKQIEELNFIGEIESSSDFFVSILLDSVHLRTALTIHGTGREELGLTSEYKSFSLPNSDLFIEISKWDIPVTGYFTNDAPIVRPKKLESWNAISGNVNILVSNIEDTQFTTYYDITLLLGNVLFENNNGEQIIVKQLYIEETNVGWFPGK